MIAAMQTPNFCAIGHLSEKIRLLGPLLQQDTEEFESAIGDTKADIRRTNYQHPERDALIRQVRHVCRSWLLFCMCCVWRSVVVVPDRTCA
jgi:hypothetical protein